MSDPLNAAEACTKPKNKSNVCWETSELKLGNILFFWGFKTEVSKLGFKTDIEITTFVNWEAEFHGYFSRTIVCIDIRLWLYDLLSKSTDYEHQIKARIKEIWNFGPMRQTKYALAVPKNLGLGFDFWLYSEVDFLTGRL